MSDRDTIHKAARRCDLEAVRRFLVVEGAHVDCRDRNGSTPLIRAAFHSREQRVSSSFVPTISLLISKNADTEATVSEGQTYGGYTALMIVSRYGNLTALKVLLEEGHANVNHTVPRIYSTATYHALGHCVVPALLQHGANANPILKPGWNSPLLNACSFRGARMIVQQLLDCGANVEAEDCNGRTAMHVAAEYSDEVTVQLLITHGASVDPQKKITYTPASIAAHHGNAATLRTLLDNGAKVDKAFDHGRGLFHYVQRDAETFGVLLNHCRSTMTGNFLLESDNEGAIALHRTTTVEVAKLLVEQPRRQNNQLSPVCHAQLLWRKNNGMTPMDEAALGLFGSHCMASKQQKPSIILWQGTSFTTSAQCSGRGVRAGMSL